MGDKSYLITFNIDDTILSASFTVNGVDRCIAYIHSPICKIPVGVSIINGNVDNLKSVSFLRGVPKVRQTLRCQAIIFILMENNFPDSTCIKEVVGARRCAATTRSLRSRSHLKTTNSWRQQASTVRLLDVAHLSRSSKSQW